MKQVLIFLWIGTTSLLTAQEGEQAPKKWLLGGYVKDLQSAFVVDNFFNPFAGKKIVIADNLLHNRLNAKWLPSEQFHFAAEARNRFFWGDQPAIPTNDFRAQLDAANDFFDLSAEWSDPAGAAAQVMLDRIYADWSAGKLEVRAGRQRINWGIATVWNPNDIFNAYNFADFDYEERPGSDALRIRYFTGIASGVEFAIKAADRWRETVAAGLLKLNRWGYDFQILGGYFQEEIVLGGGWAGNIEGAGWKGECSFFQPINDGTTSFAASMNIDYQFSNALYFNSGLLYNSNGATNGDLTNLFALELSAKNLYPFRYAIFAQGLYPVTPLFNAGMAIIYSPVSSHALFLNPTATYSIATNWDLDFVSQIIFNKKGKNYISPVQAGFLRIKRSF